MTEREKYLRPTDTIDCDHATIRATASELTEGCLTPREKALRLFRHVRDEIPYSLYMISVFKEDFTASRILAWGKGYCVQKAVLLAALARAAGIPAQIEAGLVYLKGRFFYHAWNTLYVGNWVTADAVTGDMPADVTHIRLVRGEADRQMDLMGVIGRLQLEIVDMKK